MAERDTEKAFLWIVGILERYKISFCIAGGLAARIYGSQRELADIDIVIPQGAIAKILPEIKQYLFFGPGQYRDENWDLWMVTLRYEGQEIDLCENETISIFDQGTKQWVPLRTNIASALKVTIFGTETPIIPREELITYKKKLARAVDLEDVKQISK